MKRKLEEVEGSTNRGDDVKKKIKRDMCGIWTLVMVIILIECLYEAAMRKAKVGGHTCNLRFYELDWIGIAEKINISGCKPATPISWSQVKQKAAELRSFKCSCLVDIQNKHANIWKLFLGYRQLHTRMPLQEKLQTSMQVDMYELAESSMMKSSFLGKRKTFSTSASVQAPPDTYDALAVCLKRLEHMQWAGEITKDIHENAHMMLYKEDKPKWIVMLNAMDAVGPRGQFVKKTVKEFMEKELAGNDQ